MMPINPHEKTQYEFAAKRVNDMLREEFPDEQLQFMSFVMDAGESGFIGYLASTRRIDAVRTIMEWLDKSISGFSRDELRELLVELEKEMGKS